MDMPHFRTPKEELLPSEAVRVKRDTWPRRNLVFEFVRVVLDQNYTLISFFRCLTAIPRFSDLTSAPLIQEDHDHLNLTEEKSSPVDLVIWWVVLNRVGIVGVRFIVMSLLMQVMVDGCC